MHSLRRFLATYKLELRIICLHWSYGLLHLLWLSFFLANSSNFNHQISYQSADEILFSMSLGLIPLIALVAMMLTGISASRSQRIQFDLLEAAYPTGPEIIVGRWAAVVTSASLFLAIPIVLALISGPFASFLKALPVFLLESLLLFAFISALIWIIQVTIGIRRWIYPLFALVWLGSAIIPQSFNIFLTPAILLTAFTTQGQINTDYSALWERLALRNIPLYYDLFYLALVILCVSVVVWWTYKKRFYQRSITAIVVIILSLSSALIAGRAYSLEVADANSQAREADLFYSDHFSDITLPADMPYTVRAYDVSLDLQDFSNPQFDVQMEIFNRGTASLNEVDLSLNSQFTIIDEDQQYERDYDFITLTLPEALSPGASQTIHISYEGALWYYYRTYTQGNYRVVNSFISPHGINLSCAAAWYPVPGHIIVGREYFAGIFNSDSGFLKGTARNYPDCMLDEAAQFNLRVQNSGKLTLASNLKSIGGNKFSATATTWVHLIAAPGLVTENVEGIALVTSGSLLPSARSIIEEYYKPSLEYHRTIYPEIEGLTIFALSRGFGTYYSPTTTPITDGNATVVVAPFYLTAIPLNPYNDYLFNGQAILNSLYRVNGQRWYTSYLENIGYFLWAHYMAEGDADRMETILAEGIPQGDVGLRTYYYAPNEEVYPIAFLLYDIYVQQGEAAIIDLLHQIYTEADTLNTLSSEDVYTWIEEAAHAD